MRNQKVIDRLPPSNHYCVRCLSNNTLLDHDAVGWSGPVCVNRTRCDKSIIRHKQAVQTFIRRLRGMPPQRRYEWVRAIRDEVWPDFDLKSRRSSRRQDDSADVDTGATFD